MTYVGVSKEELWQAIDTCNCDRVFGKHYLHSTHGPDCLDWNYVSNNASLSAPSPTSTSSSGSVVEDLLTLLEGERIIDHGNKAKRAIPVNDVGIGSGNIIDNAFGVNNWKDVFGNL
ncbi:hypothetical protein M422DRAFT_262613 [Sphaerobolus stellatus SS14]|uniref:Uncharacterized protein n=1 Tax=Sphaerobolus stellatus (strain SS14) TaxID=990650 RepID=A0A0C9V0U7_SPHS4|nr:hypothetical protein M422DRAFT_262613 [Sphaerobolus stellatus SS14]